MNWYRLAQNAQMLKGYKMVAWDGNRAYSLYDPGMTIDTTIGSSISAEGKGIHLGSSKEFCQNYYSEMTDDQDMLLTYEFLPEDLLSGNPDHPNDELTVKQARLTAYELV